MNAKLIYELFSAVTNFLKEKGHAIRAMTFNADTRYFTVDTVSDGKIYTFSFYEKE